MAELDPDRRNLAEQLRREIATEDTLTRNQARSFVRGLQTSWDVPTIQWSEQDSLDQLSDARRLLDAAEIFQNVEGRTSRNATSCFRRSGELLEWLTRSKDTLDLSIPLELLAAAAFQLGGLPAMATALLKQVNIDSLGKQIYSKFLYADFDGVIYYISEFWSQNLSVADQQASARIVEEHGEDKVGWHVTVELIRALGALADAFRRGDDQRINLAIKKMSSIDKIALRTFDETTTTFLRLLYQVSITYRDSSIYSPIRKLASLNAERASHLENFARNQFGRGRGILWASQQQGIARLIEEPSFALCTPTGSGKTLVANLALIRELILHGQTDPAPLALYLVPSRALAGEVERKLTDELGHELTVTGLYGGADWGITDYWLEADTPTVLVATVEKADALMRYLGPLLTYRLRLLVVDEAHQIVPQNDERTQVDFAEHSNRSIRLESLVSRLINQVPNLIRVALTAVAGGAASPVARWIESDQAADAVGTDYRSTRQVVGVLETGHPGPGRMRLEFMNDHLLSVRGRRNKPYLPLRIPAMPALPARLRNSIYCATELEVLWTAIYLSNQDRRVLISVAQEPEKTMGWYKKALDLDSWQSALTFSLPEEQNKRELFEEARATCIDYCGQDSYELALLDQGIATNHGQMPQRLRRLMTDLIEQNICPVTVATATLTEGVNLPFDLIFLTALKRRSYDPIRNRRIENPMTAGEFRNLSGRAGRPGASNGMEGITMVPRPTRPSSTAPQKVEDQRRQIYHLNAEFEEFRRSLRSYETEDSVVYSPISLLLQGIFDRAKDLLGLDNDTFLEWLEATAPEHISHEAGYANTSEESRLADSLDELDGILLTAIYELERVAESELHGSYLEEAMIGLWRTTFSAYAAAQEEWLQNAFVRRGRAIVETFYSDAEERGRLYQYGFTPYVGRRFAAIEGGMREVIQRAEDYGRMSAEDRFSVFVSIGDLVAGDPGYGFRVRDTQTDRSLLQNWQGLLAWWLLAPDAPAPNPANLRSWQRFVSENIETRLGVTIGAVAARSWSEGAGDTLMVPSLDEWKETTRLPWFGFWARELLRWGTLDPFVAFSLAQGLAKTRNEAANRRPEFDNWLSSNVDSPSAEDFIDPQLFLSWKRDGRDRISPAATGASIEAKLSGTSGLRGAYHVVPLFSGNVINWIDPAGYIIAESRRDEFLFRGSLHGQDFELITNSKTPFVRRTFTR